VFRSSLNISFMVSDAFALLLNEKPVNNKSRIIFAFISCVGIKYGVKTKPNNALWYKKEVRSRSTQV